MRDPSSKAPGSLADGSSRAEAGSLVVAGLGIAGPAHATRETLAAIRHAETLFYLVADPLSRAWLLELRPDAADLADTYAVGKSRDRSYREMVRRILAPVRAGRSVCALYYGHPGVFATPPHVAVRRARREGFEARMLPAVSAEDCLFADLGVDPSETGCQSYEATDFLLRRRRVDPTAALVLWQIGLVGVDDVREEELWSAEGLHVLVTTLLGIYPPAHRVTVYEASTLPVAPPRIERVRLERLERTRVSALSTLYVPPLPDRATDRRMARRLGLVD